VYSKIIVEELEGVDASGCSCNLYIPVGRGHGFKPILFSSCDQKFTLMKLNGRLNLFGKTDSTHDIENEVEVTLSNSFYIISLNLKKTGAGEESLRYEGELKVNKGKHQQIIKVVGACGL